jgi:imidazolonepropionase-like amidohydrolase
MTHSPKRLAAPIAILVGAVVAACQPSEAGTGNAPDDALLQSAESIVAFVGVNVLPMDSERTLADHTVIVADERVAAIGPAGSVDVPESAVIIEGAGKWLLPGLGEMHAHVPPDGEAAERVLFLYLSQGITTARGMLGQPGHLSLRERLASGDALGPRLYTSGPSLNGNSIPDADSARAAVMHQVELGYDFMKIHPGLSLEEYDAIAATGTETGLDWAGHVPAEVGLARALEVQQASIDHLDLYMEAIVTEGTDVSQSLFFGLNLARSIDEAKIVEVARATAEAGVWNVPTQSLIENMASTESPESMAAWPSMRYMPPQQVQGWVQQKEGFLASPAYNPEDAALAIDVRRRIIKALHDAGAGLLLGSDAPQVFQVPGFSIQHELEILVESGLTPYEALRVGTYNVAEYFDSLDEFGTVATGMSADFVVVNGDPLADITNMADRAGVMIRGRWVPASEIEERLETIAASY